MIKRKNGYSLGVLVITIAVMLILTTTALVSYKSMSADKAITNFMNDIKEVEEYVKEYYAEKRVLPIQYDEATSMPVVINTLEYDKIREQASDDESGGYYFIDLSKLERINLKDYNRGYIVNENSLKVYVVKAISFEGVDYYTVTDEMKGYDTSYNENDNFEVIISGNPITWTDKAKLILSIANYENIDAKDWTFKYYTPGPITAEEFNSKGKMFLYGESVEVTENEIVTFYVENIGSGESEEVGYVKIINVVVNKIDDIRPSIRISGDRRNEGEIIIIDNETGINEDRLRYKIIGDDLHNPAEGIPLVTYGTKYANYIEQYNLLISTYDDLTNEIEHLIGSGSGESDVAGLRENQAEIRVAIQELNDNNRSFNNGTEPYSDLENNIALYVEDYAGNMTEDVLGVSRKVLLNSNLVDFEAKLLDNSTFSIVKNATQYTSGDSVNLRIRSQGATKMILTTNSEILPTDIANYTLPYESSNGDYEFDISAEVGPEVKIYAYYTAEEYDNEGNLIYKAFEDSIKIDRVNPTDDAPEVEISNRLKLTINVKQKDNESSIRQVKYGYRDASEEDDINSYDWYDTVEELEEKIQEGKTYYIRTKVVDEAGNGPVISEYTKIQCPTGKIIATPNKPVLGNLQAITWNNNLDEISIDSYTLKDENGTTWVWYDYKLGDGENDTGESKWANAKAADGSYWVWIPRYAYRIIYYTDSTKSEVSGYYQNSGYSNVTGYYMPDGKTMANAEDVKTKYGEVDIVFLYDNTDDKYYDTETKLVKSVIAGGEKVFSEYIVHPAFKAYPSGTTVNNLGKWNRELNGIWVSKFETSRTDATFTSQGVEANIKSVPNVKSITGISINEAFNYGLQYNASLNSHLMKNSEWGAVAYLAYSAYGRNGNKIKQNLSSDMIAGGGTSNSGAQYSTTSQPIFESRYGYKTNVGMQTSTTKNVYGVYDLVGGAYEYVSAYVNNGEGVVASNGGLLQNDLMMHLAQSYSEGVIDDSINNYEANSSVYGDGIQEVSENGTTTWDNNKLTYPSGGTPFFIRGGSYESTNSTVGIFELGASVGSANDKITFRMVLAP